MKITKSLLYLSIIFVSALFITGCVEQTNELSNNQGNQGSNNQIEAETEAFVFDEISYDFGVIKQSGGKVTHDFPFTYKGDQTVEVTGVPTSCACTSATINPTTLEPGDSGILTVKFNPNLHAEPEGKFFKTASIITKPEIDEIPEVKIWAEIDLDLGPEAFELQSDHDDSEEEHAENTYTSITPKEFERMRNEEEFFLIDTHIPEQEHIMGTDAFIPFNEISHNEDKLPVDKDAKIIVYCRSGSMSRAAAYTLVEHGYTNVYDLVGGKIAYDEYQSE